MNTQRIDELERELRFEVPEPPSGLRERLLAEVPAELPVVAVDAETADSSLAHLAEEMPPVVATGAGAEGPHGLATVPWWRRPRLLAAAAGLGVLALATSVVLRMDAPSPGERAATFAGQGSGVEAAAGRLQAEQRRRLDEASPPPAVSVDAAGPLAEDANENARSLRRKEQSKRVPMPDSGRVEHLLAPAPEPRSESAMRRERAGAEGDLDAFHDDLEVVGEAPVVDAQASVAASNYVADRRAADSAGEAGKPATIVVSGEAPVVDPNPRLAPAAPIEALRVQPPPALSTLPRPVPSAPQTGAAPSGRQQPATRGEGGDRKIIAGSSETAAPGISFRGGSPQVVADPQPEDPLHVSEVVIPTPAPSTGGTAEPNDKPYGDMFFRPSDSNPFVDTEDDALSTFGLDVDTGSYTLARSYLDRGHLPEPDGIRVEEWVNAFGPLYGDVAPLRDDFALTAEGAPSPFAGGERYRLLRFGIRARELTRAERPPVVLTFVIDVSGSMNREDRLALVKRALDLLLDALDEGDRVGVVVYGSQARIVLPHSEDLERVRAAVHGLYSEGSTNAEAGLALGYDLAGAAFRERATNRVVLCSDGVANVGATGPESILERIGAEARRGIELTTIGFGMGNYNDALMERLADQGDGRYAYVDTLAEARRLFVDELSGTLHSIAADAKVQVAFDPAVVERWRLLGYENRDVADERFRDDTVDAGEIGFGHAVTALYEVKLREDAPRRGTVARLALRYRQLASGEVIETQRGLALGDLASRWERARPELRLASAVAETAELLRRSFWAKGSTFAAVARELDRLPDRLADEERVRELARMVAVAQRLAAAAPGGDPRSGDAGVDDHRREDR